MITFTPRHRFGGCYEHQSSPQVVVADSNRGHCRSGGFARRHRSGAGERAASCARVAPASIPQSSSLVGGTVIAAGTLLSVLGKPLSGATDPACSPYQLRDYGSTQSQVGGTFSSGGGMTTTFSYGKGASSTLGVGVSATEVGGFSASGTKSVSTSATETFPVANGAVNRSYSTDFDYREYLYGCFGYTSYAAQPVSWYGGAITGSATRPAAGDCVAQYAGSIFTVNTTKASAFSTGVSIASQIGINLSADTGYSTTASIVFNFVSQGHPLCGVHGFPGSTNPAPGLLTVHPGIL